MRYVDGFLIALPKKNLAAYKRMSAKAGKIWMQYGALDYKECVGDDLAPEGIKTLFPKIAGVKKGEVVIFAFIVYKSKKQRDTINAKIMKDPRMAPPMKDGKYVMPFDMDRMAVGGFKVFVDMI